jgi:multidrug resistance efflux pump
MRAKLEEAEQALTKAMALHDQGVLSLRELEQRELELDEARYAARAIDLPTLHARRAQSFARELERLQQLFLQGVVSDAEVQRARAFVAYERFRAGGSRDDYVAARQACRSWMEARDAALARAGAVSVKQLERDLAELEKTVPDPDVPGER